MQIAATSVTPTAMAAPPQERALLDTRRWRRFLRQRSLGGVEICDYYEQFPGRAIAHENTRSLVSLVESIWYDLVASGTITLPKGAHATSFSFSVSERQCGPFVGLDLESLVVQNKNNGKESVVAINPINILNANRGRKMSSRYLEHLMTSIRDAVQKTL